MGQQSPAAFDPAVHAGMMDAEVALFFSRAVGDADAYNSDGSHAGEFVGPCHSCGFDLMLRQRDDQKFVVACIGAPSCKESVYLPRATLAVSVSEDHCQDCHHGIVHKLNLRYENNHGVLIYCLVAASDRPSDATLPVVRHAWYTNRRGAVCYWVNFHTQSLLESMAMLCVTAHVFTQ